jgi:squalene-hopene/tetraprenyl-beta-curcumene cyclase
VFSKTVIQPAQESVNVLRASYSAGEVRLFDVLTEQRRLIDTQKADGTWDEDLATGTGFPGVFYLSYHLYRNSFPTLALAAFLKGKEA